MTPSTLTARQRQVYEFLCECEDKFAPPTIREIADKFGFQINAANGHLLALAKKGLIARTAESSSRCWHTTRSTVERLAAIWKRCTRKEREAFLDGARIN